MKKLITLVIVLLAAALLAVSCHKDEKVSIVGTWELGRVMMVMTVDDETIEASTGQELGAELYALACKKIPGFSLLVDESDLVELFTIGGYDMMEEAQGSVRLGLNSDESMQAWYKEDGVWEEEDISDYNYSYAGGILHVYVPTEQGGQTVEEDVQFKVTKLTATEMTWMQIVSEFEEVKAPLTKDLSEDAQMAIMEAFLNLLSKANIYYQLDFTRIFTAK